MLKILYKNKFGDYSSSYWRIGDGRPISMFVENLKEYDFVVYADGEELRYILDSFVNIRKVCGRDELRWFGDDAKFIAANL